ncbi:hypothetical protein GCM10022232_38200 [Streptomyces plumbiresistens]|uniref:Uncharacterized protein n=1 Tax=Streptomyces plumbiresistens TaxID=511811 RepID=A0ABP7RHA1_9ACTN
MTRTSPIFGKDRSPPVVIFHRAFAVKRTACRLSLRDPQGLLEHDSGHLAEPCALFGELGIGDQQLGQVPGLRERLACSAGGLTGAKRIVVDHPRTPERPGQR